MRKFELLFNRRGRMLGAMLFAFALIIALLSMASVASASGPTIATGLDDYEPGDTVSVTGSGFAPGEIVNLLAVGSTNGSQIASQASADENGNISGSFDLPIMFEATYSLTAVGADSGLQASISFYDFVSAFNIVSPVSPVSLSTGVTQTYTVLAKTQGNTTVPGLTVNWTATGGTMAPLSSVTGSDGQASSDYKAGTVPGSYVVTATAPGAGQNGKDKTDTQAVTISKVTPTITWANPADIVYGTALNATQLNATASVPGTFAYSPTAGTVLNAGNGQTLSVAFTPTDSTNYNTATASVTINVLKADPVITWSNPADIIYGTLLSSTQLNATADVPGSFVYSPAAGTKLSAGNGQTLHVDFTPTDTANYNTATKSVSINVLKADPVITWSNPADVVYGTPLSSTQLNATADVPGSFAYTPAAGTVLNAGSSQTLSATFTPTDSTNYNTATKSVTINVLKADAKITWSNPADIIYGTLLSGAQLNATADVPGSFVYSPAAGTKLNAGNGQTLHTDFTPTDTANYNTASKDVTINVLKATPTITWSNPADIVYGTALGASQLNATADVPGSFVYTPVAGTVLNAGNGQTLSVTFTPTDSTNYNIATATITINVLKADPKITWNNPADIVYGTLLSGTQLNAAADVPGSFAYTPGAGTKLNAGNGQTLHTDFTPTDTANYNTASKDVTINVLKADPVITWTNPADIVYGTVLSSTQLNATADVPGSFAYTPAAGTKLSAGNGQTLHVDFTPTDTANYNNASKNVTINVLKATPMITWSNPADITYGTALNGTQLNATANVPGSFVYTPAAGTVLGVGSGQTLHVDFTPTDTANYNSASKNVTINVYYAWSGILQPIRTDGLSRFKLGSTIPIKFQLFDGGTPIGNCVAKLFVAQGDNVPDPGVDEAISTSAATTGNLFRYDSTSQQYIFNLSTKLGYTNPDGTVISFIPGTWTLKILLDDGSWHSVVIQLVR